MHAASQLLVHTSRPGAQLRLSRNRAGIMVDMHRVTLKTSFKSEEMYIDTEAEMMASEDAVPLIASSRMLKLGERLKLATETVIQLQEV
jgi:hypothetical protein